MYNIKLLFKVKNNWYEIEITWKDLKKNGKQ